MSGGFSFPPPPPPPPKATSPPGGQVEAQSSNYRGRGGGGQHGHNNSRGRVRGRGQSGWRGNRGHPSTQSQRNPGHHGGWNSSPPHGQPASGLSQSFTNPQQAQAYDLPPGSYVNPTFAYSHSASNRTQRSPEPDGMSNAKAGSPQRTTAGHKRKLEALREPPQPKKRPGPATAPAVPGFGVPILPPKPTASAETARVTGSPHAKQKSTRNGLGLTPATHDPQYPSSDEEQDGREIDEEAMYAELGDKLTFEHNGIILSLNSQADLAAWKLERQKKWPTKARMVEREEERRRVGEVRKRLLASAGSLQFSPRKTDSKSKVRRGKGFGSKTDPAAHDYGSRSGEFPNADAIAQPQTDLEKAKAQFAKQTKSLDDLRKKVAESEARNRKAKADMDRLNETSRPNEQPDAIDTESPPIEADQDELPANNLNDAKDEEAVGADEMSYYSVSDYSSDVSSDSSSKPDSDDDAPEEVTSKPSPLPTIKPQKPPCRYFVVSGYCRDGDACRFGHVLPSRTSRDHGIVQSQQEQQNNQQAPRSERPPRLENVLKEKKSIFQRLKEQEKDAEDRLALQVIKYLGKAGLFSDVGSDDA